MSRHEADFNARITDMSYIMVYLELTFILLLL